MSETPVRKRYNNYTLAILFGILAGLGVTLALIFSAHLTSELLPEWQYQLLCSIYAALSVSQVVSGTGYLFTGFDILFNEKTVVDAAQEIHRKEYFKKKFLDFVMKRKWEFIGLIIGIALALALTAFLLIKQIGGLFVKFIPGVGGIISLVMNVSVIAGFFSRMGRCIDHRRNNNGSENNSKFFRGENINYVLSVLIGAAIGALIGGLLLGFVGVTTVMTAGGATPLWLAAIVFLGGTVSSCASASGYIGRAFDFFLGKRVIGMKREELESPVEGIKKRMNAEKVGTLIGISCGIALGLTLILTGLAASSFFGLGLPVAAAGVLIMVSCISGLGGLGNRVGAFLTKLNKKEAPPIEPIEPPQKPLTLVEANQAEKNHQHSPGTGRTRSLTLFGKPPEEKTQVQEQHFNQQNADEGIQIRFGI